MKKLRRLLLVAISMSVVSGSLFSLTPQKTLAATSGKWIDKSTIVVDGKVYRDGNTNDTTYRYEIVDRSSCLSYVTINNYSGKGIVAELHDLNKEASGKCSGSEEVSLAQPERRVINAYQLNDQTIFMPHYYGGDNGFFIRFKNSEPINDNPQTCEQRGYLGTKDNIDKGKCTVWSLCDGIGSGGVGVSCSQAAKNSVAAKWIETTNDNLQATVHDCNSLGCETDYIKLNFGGSRAITVPDPLAGYPTIESEQATNAASDDSTAVPDDCEFSGSWNPVKVGESALNWFGCTVIKALTGIIDAATSAIGEMLQTSEDPAQKAALQSVWAQFLTIANILFVISFLIMTLSTALNLGFFDAYTVKKLLPKIIAAAILANLSFPLCYVLISITNTLGGEVYRIIASAGGVSGDFGQVGAGAGAAISAGLITAIVGLGGAVATGGIFAVIPALLYALFGIIVAYAIILIRRMIIILLIVLSPVAIVLWVIPGMDGWAKRWWKTFMQMLMVYPIIMALIAAGSFSAKLILESTKNSAGVPEPGFIESIQVLIVLILPLFLLPTVFKLATSTIANVTGMINNKGKGLFDKGANKARERAKTTERAQGKDFAKQFKASERGDRGKLHKMGSMAENARAGGMRGAWAKRGLDSESIDVLEANRNEALVRRQMAQEKSKGALKGAAELDLNNVMKTGKHKGAQAFDAGDRNAQKTFAKDVAMGTVSMGETEQEQKAARAVARTWLANNKATTELEQVRENAIQTQVTTGDSGKLDEWNGYINGGGYDEMRKSSAHLARNVNMAELSSDARTAGRSLSDQLRYNDGKALASEGTEILAGQTKQSWQKFKDYDDPDARAKVAEVAANDNLKGKLTDDVRGIF